MFENSAKIKLLRLYCNRSFPSSPGPLYQNKVKCSAFDMGMIFHSHANEAHFHKKGCAIILILKVRVFGTRKWPITATCKYFKHNLIRQSNRTF